MMRLRGIFSIIKSYFFFIRKYPNAATTTIAATATAIYIMVLSAGRGSSVISGLVAGIPDGTMA
jgi:hypothetical protein